MECNYCKGICIKKGRYKGVQKYKCKACFKGQRTVYRNQKYTCSTDAQIATLNNEGVGISSISRILSIPKASVQRRIIRLSSKINVPSCDETGEVYEVDELFAYSKNKKPRFIIYAINSKTRRVIDFSIGTRTKENIGKVIRSLLSLSPKRIYTDKLPVFTYLIPKTVHHTFQYRTNRIERKNLTLRTHLKRLSRKTICYSKSLAMLEACFRLYVWR